MPKTHHKSGAPTAYGLKQGYTQYFSTKDLWGQLSLRRPVYRYFVCLGNSPFTTQMRARPTWCFERHADALKFFRILKAWLVWFSDDRFPLEPQRERFNEYFETLREGMKTDREYILRHEAAAKKNPPAFVAILKWRAVLIHDE